MEVAKGEHGTPVAVEVQTRICANETGAPPSEAGATTWPDRQVPCEYT
jgi:hypothetical protein